ncbi:hypothetical protein DR046_02760 [Jannaschia formosa]|nr:hypothetical protein DR046_02760 [Jannaschia formosa]
MTCGDVAPDPFAKVHRVGSAIDDPEAVVSGADLILRFNHWAERQGLAGWTQRSLVKELKARGFEEGRRSDYRGLKGLRLR